jgi:hypothetical protein
MRLSLQVTSFNQFEDINGTIITYDNGEQMSMKRILKLTVKPEWNEIEEARNKASKFLKSLGLVTDSVHSLTMVISELIENGVKYGNFSVPAEKVEVDIQQSENIITVEVINPVDPTDEATHNHLTKLDKTVQWIRGYQDPFEAYVEKLKEVSRRPLNDEESGLGLVRIAYEGKAILDFFVGEDGSLNVSAVSNFQGDNYGKD